MTRNRSDTYRPSAAFSGHVTEDWSRTFSNVDRHNVNTADAATELTFDIGTVEHSELPSQNEPFNKNIEKLSVNNIV